MPIDIILLYLYVDTYCAIEVDSFGHFFMKAKTDVCPNSKEPTWNQVC